MALKKYENKGLKNYSNKITNKKDTKKFKKVEGIEVMFLEKTYVEWKVFDHRSWWVKWLKESTVKELKQSPFAKKNKILFSK